MRFFQIFFFVMGTIFITAQSSSYERTETLADSLSAAKNYSAAIVHYNKMLREKPKDRFILSSLGFAYFNSKDFNKAREAYRLAALYCPSNEVDFLARSYSNLSACYSNLGDDQKGYDYAVKAYNLKQDSDLGLWNAASLSQNIDRCNDAIALMDNAKITKSNSFNTLYGRCYYKKKEYEKAAEYYETFFENYDPDDDFVSFDLEEERKYLDLAYYFLAAKESQSSGKSTVYQDKLLNLMDKMKTNASRNDIVKSFTNEDNLSNKFDFSKAYIKKLYARAVDNPSPFENTKFSYAIEDYAEAYEMSSQILKSGSISKNDQKELQLLRYYSFINLIFRDLKKKGEINADQITTAREMHEKLYDPKVDYDKFDTDELRDNMEPAARTVRLFKKYFTSDESTKKNEIYLRQILKTSPSKKFNEIVTAEINIDQLKY